MSVNCSVCDGPRIPLTVHGGEKHLDLTSRQRSIIGSGLIRATRTTEAWIMSIGLHSGVGELVGSALHDHQLMRRGRIRAVGVAPWGIVDNREDLLHGDSKDGFQNDASQLDQRTCISISL